MKRQVDNYIKSNVYLQYNINYIKFIKKIIIISYL